MRGPRAQFILNIGGFDLITKRQRMARFLLLAAGLSAKRRSTILHPCTAWDSLVAAGLIALHFWRVRKDGGISQPL